MRAYKDQATESCYPGFADLTSLIAQRLRRPLTTLEQGLLQKGGIDRLLGEWDDENSDVRSHAAAILTANVEFQRLDLHRAIIRLFSNSETPRIVTTNFDDLLLRAIAAEGYQLGAKWNVNVAPALPPARRLSGVCYLHGRVDQPRDMVLTDKDIGRAYMDEGWALRFAHSVFQRFDILFIGYSLEDPPLRYLSLALEGNTEQKRWALVPDIQDILSKTEAERDWRRRNVEPIWFAAVDHDYRPLERTLDAWGNDNARSFLDRRKFLLDIGKSKPGQLKPHELSRTKYFLEDAPSLRDFAKATLDLEWFDTLLASGHYDHLLKGSVAWSEASGFLVERFVDWMIHDPVNALVKVTAHRSTLHSSLFEQFCRRYQNRAAPGIDIPLLRKIVEFFRPAIDRTRVSISTATFIKQILADLLDARCEDDAFWLLSVFLRTETIVTKGMNFAFEATKYEGKVTNSIPEFDLEYDLQFESQIAEHNVKELIEEAFAPRMQIVGARLVHFLTTKFMEVHSFYKRGKVSRLGSQIQAPRD